jgi:hypothetical protein
MRAAGVLVAVWLCLVCVPAWPATVEPCPTAVRVSLPNFEIKPYVLGTDRVESPPGLLIEWTRKAVAAAAGPNCKPHLSVLRRPPNRQLAEVAQGLLDVLPGFSYSASSSDALVYPLDQGAPDPGRAIMADTVSLYVRADDHAVRWDGSTLLSPNPLVGSSTGGAATEETAQRYGWRIESAATPRTDLHKLLAGRIDVIMEPDVVMTPLIAGARVRKLTPPARQTLRYAAVRKGFAAQYPAFTERFWREMCLASRAGGTVLPACR